MSLSGWKEEFEGKRILIWGYGREGRSTYALIRKVSDQPLTIADSVKIKEEGLRRIEKECKGVTAIFESDICPEEYDMIIKSPGIVLKDGFDRSKLVAQTDLFLKHYGHQVIGVTGTKGKSTTTSLIHEVLKQKYSTYLVGNIGIPCFDVVEDLQPSDLVAFEISAHQLEYCSYSPHVAVFLNLFEEHLDHYGTMERYGAAKSNILLHQGSEDVAIVHESLKDLCAHVQAPVVIGKDIRTEGDTLIIPGHRLKVSDCALIGAHNELNLAVAFYVGALFGIDESSFLNAAHSFKPLHHRLEDLGVVHGIRYVNDSISTIGQSCVQALEALPETDSVLVGGMDRGIEYEELEAYLHDHPSVHVVFMYATGHRIFEEMKNKGIAHDNMECVEDLRMAVECARAHTRPGHICLLSPAASSYDHFKNFEERGACFEAMVKGHEA